MPESIINTIITSVTTLLGALVGAYATMWAARVKLSGGSEGVPPQNPLTWVWGALLGAAAMLGLLFLFGFFPPDGPGVEGTIGQIPIYDTFNNAVHDGGLDDDRWTLNANDRMFAYQENGRMVLEASTPAEYGAMWINPVSGLETSIQEHNVIEAKFSWEPKFYNKLYLGLTIQHTWTDANVVVYVCDFVMEDQTTVFSCNGVNGDEVVSSVYVSVPQNQTYTLRIEIDPDTAVFSTYLDNRLVSTYQPPEPGKWIEGPISFNIHLGSDPLSSGRFYVDDVRFGNLK